MVMKILTIGGNQTPIDPGNLVSGDDNILPITMPKISPTIPRKKYGADIFNRYLTEIKTITDKTKIIKNRGN